MQHEVVLEAVAAASRRAERAPGRRPQASKWRRFMRLRDSPAGSGAVLMLDNGGIGRVGHTSIEV